MKNFGQAAAVMVMSFVLGGCVQESSSNTAAESRAPKPDAVKLSIGSSSSQDLFDEGDASSTPTIIRPSESTVARVEPDSISDVAPAESIPRYRIFKSLGRAVQQAFSSVEDENTSEQGSQVFPLGP